jgi:hypothetical protein
MGSRIQSTRGTHSHAQTGLPGRYEAFLCHKCFFKLRANILCLQIPWADPRGWLAVLARADQTPQLLWAQATHAIHCSKWIWARTYCQRKRRAAEGKNCQSTVEPPHPAEMAVSHPSADLHASSIVVGAGVHDEVGYGLASPIFLSSATLYPNPSFVCQPKSRLNMAKGVGRVFFSFFFVFFPFLSDAQIGVCRCSLLPYRATIAYPRYFNNPNQDAVALKVAALEGAQDGIVFSSGMAAISTVLLSFMESGSHAIFWYEITINCCSAALPLTALHQLVTLRWHTSLSQLRVSQVGL